jgi:hypothetical protein
MAERNDTETPSYREKRGKKPADADGRERVAEVPLAPSGAGTVGAPGPRDRSSPDGDGAAVERGEVF